MPSRTRRKIRQEKADCRVAMARLLDKEDAIISGTELRKRRKEAYRA